MRLDAHIIQPHHPSTPNVESENSEDEKEMIETSLSPSPPSSSKNWAMA
jgi:hypothetical protein